MASSVRGPLTIPGLGGVALASDPGAAGRELPDRDVTAVNSPGFEASNRKSRELEAEQDRVLIESAQKGDKLAFKKLVQRHQRRAYAIALGLLRDEQDAREVVQEAFLRGLDGLTGLREPGSFGHWLTSRLHAPSPACGLF